MEFDKNLLGGSTALLVLSLLKERDMYGYEIIRELDRRSEHLFQFQEGTLYPVLHRCEGQGYLKSYQKQAENGKNRKYYAITPAGLQQLETERVRFKKFTFAVGRVLGEGGYAFA